MTDKQEELSNRYEYGETYIYFDNDSKEVSLDGEFTKAQLLEIAMLIPD